MSLVIKKKKKFKFSVLSFKFYFFIKRLKKLQHCNFFSFYNVKILFEFIKRFRFDGLSNLFLKYLKYTFICLKYDFFLDPVYILLLHIECLSIPIYLYKKWSKKANIPLDKMYRLYIGYRVRSLFRGSKSLIGSFLSVKKNCNLSLKMYREFIGLYFFVVSFSLNSLEQNLLGMFVNKRSRYV